MFVIFSDLERVRLGENVGNKHVGAIEIEFTVFVVVVLDVERVRFGERFGNGSTVAFTQLERVFFFVKFSEFANVFSFDLMWAFLIFSDVLFPSFFAPIDFDRVVGLTMFALRMNTTD